MTDQEIDTFLAGRHTMNVATHSSDGTIHLVAMWYGFCEDTLAFVTYGKSQKVLNLRRDPRMTVLVEDGDAYEELRGVEMVGTGEIIEDPDRVVAAGLSVVQRYNPIDDPEALEEAARLMVAKRVAVAVRADRVVSWDHGKL